MLNIVKLKFVTLNINIIGCWILNVEIYLGAISIGDVIKEKINLQPLYH